MSDAMLQVQDLHAGYGPIEVLKGISLEVRRGEDPSDRLLVIDDAQRRVVGPGRAVCAEDVPADVESGAWKVIESEGHHRRRPRAPANRLSGASHLCYNVSAPAR